MIPGLELAQELDFGSLIGQFRLWLIFIGITGIGSTVPTIKIDLNFALCFSEITLQLTMRSDKSSDLSPLNMWG